MPPIVADPRPVDLELRGVTKSFELGPVAVAEFGLAVEAGELVSLLGPSGCGKTTTLRIIAGFARPDTGRVLIKGRDVTALPPDKRDVGLLFQSYALFPHMTVEGNVGYGLRMRRVPRLELARRVAEALELVRLEALAGRYPRQLSGGQQQRVALARAIVIRPSLLLLDEPLSNLDAKLRQEMRAEIRELQRRLRLTTVFVTHDQEEALAVSDRVVVMNGGRVEQIGSPRSVYRHPQTLFVARFIGEGNFLDGRVGPTTATGIRFRSDRGLECVVREADTLIEGAPSVLALRPEAIRVLEEGEGAAAFDNRWPGTIEMATYLGATIVYRVRVDAHTTVQAIRPNEDGERAGAGEPGVGARVVLAWPAAAGRLVPAPS